MPLKCFCRTSYWLPEPVVVLFEENLEFVRVAFKELGTGDFFHEVPLEHCHSKTGFAIVVTLSHADAGYGSHGFQVSKIGVLRQNPSRIPLKGFVDVLRDELLPRVV